MCNLGFFQDPTKQITDPDICAPCDCEPDGTWDGGECDGRTIEGEDGEVGMIAGKCHCKTYVGGPRCDHCSPGNK
jgi:laminin beta 1